MGANSSSNETVGCWVTTRAYKHSTHIENISLHGDEDSQST
jgi:hypothetical protein